MSNFKDEIKNLKRLSRRIGNDRLLIQAAGGNTSIKNNDIMWIKASGTQLKNATKKNIFVGVRWKEIKNTLKKNPNKADKPQLFLTKKGLKPSIETCLHAVMPHKVVVHTHCVDVIAIASQKNAKQKFKKLFGEYNWGFVKYTKPGAKLAQNVSKIIKPDMDVVFFENHGVIFGAETVKEAEKLLNIITRRIRTKPSTKSNAVTKISVPEIIRHKYKLMPKNNPLHLICRKPKQLEQVRKGALTPDQVVFCGEYVPVINNISQAEKIIKQANKKLHKQPVILLIKNVGAFVKKDASETEKKIADCVGDVMARISKNAELVYISKSECGKLLNWDAEKYRTNLNK